MSRERPPWPCAWPRSSRTARPLDQVLLERDRIDHLAGGKKRRQLLREPCAGRRVAMGEDNAPRPRLHRELQELLAVGVAAQLEALDARLYLCLHVRRLEKERVARLRGEELAAGS